MKESLLVLGRKLGFTQSDVDEQFKLLDEISYVSENQYSASLRSVQNQNEVFVKGSLEKVFSLSNGAERDELYRAEQKMAEEGYRVLAFAKGPYDKDQLNEKDIEGLNVLGLVGFKDPLREGSKELDLAHGSEEVATGKDLETHINIETKKIFARVSPTQKLQIVRKLKDLGHFVAVTGDGANDAPALKASHVGVAMGMRGTDISKESSDLIIADDHFASIVRGIFFGRVAYNNIRKVTYLLLATGAAEIILFTLSVISGLPMPLTAVQVLWVNLVTNGVQDIALAFEPAEGDELQQKPRPPKQALVDRNMISGLVLSSIVMGGVSFYIFRSQFLQGDSLESARNMTLLVMVLFGNIMIGNCRSETKSAFQIPIFSNPLLLVSVIAAQALHIWAMQNPWFSQILKVETVSIRQWFICLLYATSVLVAIELYKFYVRKFSKK